MQIYTICPIKDRKFSDYYYRPRELRCVFRNAIEKLDVADTLPPETEDDQKWKVHEWRYYSILTLFYVQGRQRRM